MSRGRDRVEKLLDAINELNETAMLVRDAAGWSVRVAVPTGRTQEFTVTAGDQTFTVSRGERRLQEVWRAPTLDAVIAMAAASEELPDAPEFDVNVTAVDREESLDGDANGRGTLPPEAAQPGDSGTDTVSTVVTPPTMESTVTAGSDTGGPVLTILNSVTGARASTPLNLSTVALEEFPTRSWDAERKMQVKTRGWRLNVADVVRETARRAGVDVDQSVAFRGRWAIEWAFEMTDVHLGDELRNPELRAEATRRAAAADRLEDHFQWSGNTVDPSADSQRRSRAQQAMQDFGMRVDESGRVVERVILVEPKLASVDAIERLYASVRARGGAIGLGYTFIATGESGVGVFELDRQGNSVAELAVAYDLGTSLGGAWRAVRPGAQLDRGGLG